MHIDFYFDPSCPFCWITSRWLIQVAEKRDITINWQPFSLALKNNELSNSNSEGSAYAQSHNEAHRILRVIEAGVAAGADRGKLYTDFGSIKHIENNPYDDMAIAIVLGINKLDASLADAADDTSYDEQLQASLATAVSIVGPDVGVPTIIFTRDDGSKVGYFGPVLQSLPDKENGLKIWDSLATLAVTHEFYELKRSRPSGLPDTGSTAGQTGPAVC